MGKLHTKEIFDLFFNSPGVSGTSLQINRRQIDKPELYAYEIEIGKELIDMDIDELFGLIREIRNKRRGKQVEYIISHSSYEQISSILRAVFNYYIDNVEVIKNPFNDKRMRGMEAVKRLSEGLDIFSWENVEDIIKRLHEDMSCDEADYIELIILMYYCGFKNAEEIITLKGDMVNHDDHTVNMSDGRVVWLTDRCYELLMKFDSLDTISRWRTDFSLVPWHDGMFKFIVRPSQVYNVNGRSLKEMSTKLNHIISVQVNDRYNTRINYRILYLLGFFDFIVEKYGENRTKEMFSSYRNSDDVKAILDAAKEYNLNMDSISQIKRAMSPFIEH